MSAAPAALRRRAPAPRYAVPLVAGAVALAVAVAGMAAGGGDDAPSAPAVRTGVATAEVRTLVDREDVQGTLGFAGERTLGAAAAGTVTRIAAEGRTVRRGGALYALDGRSTAYVMYGDTPAWRALSAGVPDGEDVRQLERNLVALGHDPGRAIEVDTTFDAATAAAVRRWERARGVAADGVVEHGEIVFTDGAVRVGAHRAERGDRVAPGRPVLSISGRDRVVTARLPAARQELVGRGDRVTVTLPGGETVRGTVAEVGTVARAGREGAEATVALEVRLPAGDVRLDGAPVTVSVARTAARRALAVPLHALLATAAGAYAVEVVEGERRRIVPVELGAFADGWVEVAGDGLRDGTRVVVPR